MNQPQVRAVGTAVPPYALGQQDIKKAVSLLFRSIEHLERLLPVFENAAIKSRHLVQPIEWYAEQHSFAESNKIFENTALDLTEKASRQAMDKAGVSPEDIGMVIFVSSTGITTPTLDSKLVQKLGLAPHTHRLPIWGLGCAGGVAGLARAAQLAGSLQGKLVLLVTVELCSLTFQRHDYSKANLIGTSIFADGAAAAIVGPDGNGPVLYNSYSTLFPDTEDVMGWDLVESGLKVRFSRDIPNIVRKKLPELLAKAKKEWGIDPGSIGHYVVHPGGAKVLQAYSESLDIPDDKLKHAYDILANYGNMSSSSVLFVLDKFMTETKPTGEYGVMLTLGPGFSAEQVLFKW
ncbi:type III polyketide synthase [Methylomusa anaerophila]|uniref:Alpha-pyrone synthesis polyketide synthase-like Pks11 n=1 Tax=Methylomusa anaerophila TaxID=1930071 RepID=A0A348AM20_9FIRM|nr:3-oxoacyl-[acyl-carrier-protein] synthase III C-terminal domain-containing protein [Methylomusa anaerophila]BBB92118.1 alpha-pyrone synthesis polyketide synthase-like Pks11 [Methylomusa anaerophila]